jgi:hypothetical protein
MTIENDARGALLLVRQMAFTIQQMQNQIVGITHSLVLEGCNVEPCRVRLFEVPRDLHGAMDSVVMPDESAQETDDDCRGRRSANGLGFGRD